MVEQMLKQEGRKVRERRIIDDPIPATIDVGASPDDATAVGFKPDGLAESVVLRGAANVGAVRIAEVAVLTFVWAAHCEGSGQRPESALELGERAIRFVKVQLEHDDAGVLAGLDAVIG